MVWHIMRLVSIGLVYSARILKVKFVISFYPDKNKNHADRDQDAFC